MLALALSLALLVPLTCYAQRSGPNHAIKPKLGTGTVTGTLAPRNECAAGSDSICVSVGRYMLQLSILNPRPPVIVGDRNLLTPGRTVRVTYGNLENSEMDVGRLFTGYAQRIIITSDSSSNPSLVIGNIKNSNVVEGCSCSLSIRRNSNSYVFLSDYEKKNAWMNVDGRDVKLSFVSSTQVRRRNRPERRGDRYTEKWAGRNVEVKIDYFVAAPMTINKEYTDYATTITVSKLGGTQTIKAVGNCGC